MSFISTYSSLSSRGWQGSGTASQTYSFITLQTGPNWPQPSQPTSFATSVDISEYVSGFNLSIIGAPSYQPSFISDPGAVFFTSFGGLSSPILGLGANDGLGLTVSISADANYAVGGAFEPGGAGYSQVYVADAFKNYTTQQTLVSPYVGEFGYASDINEVGNILALQARADTVANIVAAGSVVMFTRSGNTWSEQQRIFAGDISSSNGKGFGQSISMNASGNCVAVGAINDSNNAGAVYIFTSSGGTWTQSAKIIASDRTSDDSFGWSCALTETADYLIVGATNAGVGNIGAAYVYANVANTWTEIDIISPPSSTVTFAGFGSKVTINNDATSLVVSDPFSLVGATQKGSIYVFTQDGNNYIQTQEIINPGTTGTGTFGGDMASTYDGTKLVVADPTYNNGSETVGRVYLYQSFF